MHDLKPKYHRKLFTIALFAIVFSFSSLGSNAQDQDNFLYSPDNWSSTMGKRISHLEKKVIKRSLQSLSHLQRQEEKIFRKQLLSKDSLQAKANLEKIRKEYKELEQKLRSPGQLITAGTL